MRAFVYILLLFLTYSVAAQLPARPQPQRLYNNLSKQFPDFLGFTEATQLEEKLEVFSNETSNQIAVVIIDDLQGREASDFAFQLGNAWGIGKKNVNNGVLILVKPTGGQGGRDLVIAVGYGLEGAIPDLATKRIRDEEMYPNLKAGRNYEALDQATTVLMKLAKGEINVKDYTRPMQADDGIGPLTVIAILFVIFIVLGNIFKGGRGGGTLSGVGRGLFWGSMMGGSGRGFSSGGGGSWGGFGGGSFGGGGSGGKW